MGCGFKNPNTERQARADIERSMAHSLAGWHGPHDTPSNCARAVWEKNHGARKLGDFQLMGSVRPSPHTTGSNMRIREFNWKERDFAHGEISLSIASETYSVELDTRGAVLYGLIDGKAVRQYPENVWVRISESVARAYYELSDVADIVVVRQLFKGQRTVQVAGKAIFDRLGRPQVTTVEQTRETLLRIIERKDQFVSGEEYFLPLFMPEDSAQFPKVFHAETEGLTIIGISAMEAKQMLSSDTDYRAVFGLSGFVTIGHAFVLIRGMHINTVINPKTGTIENKFFVVELPLDKVQRGLRLKPEYSVSLASDGFLEIQ